MNNKMAPGRHPASAEGPFTFGFDIGIASVGWAVLSKECIIDCGVRVFEKAESADKGEPLNLQRRTARLLRRRLWRRAWRLTKLSRLFKRYGLLETDLLKTQPAFSDSTWKLRQEGLDRPLTNVEWARVLYHVCKHRGFHWTSRAEEAQAEADGKTEGGRVKAGLAGTAALMRDKNYRTAAEMVLAEFPESQRNKRGDYGKALSRVLLDDELRQLFEAQRAMGNAYASQQLEREIRGTGDRRTGLFWSQKPPLSGASLLAMVGKCTFEPEEHRAPKASFTAERHVWLTRLVNLRVVVDGVSRALTDQERAQAIPLPYKSAERFTYKALRKGLVKAGLLPESFRFAGLAYPAGSEKAKDPEDEVLVRLSGWHELRLCLGRDGHKAAWEQISTQALEGDSTLLDGIAWVLTIFKEDDEVKRELGALELPGGPSVVESLLAIRFDKFHALSLKALRRIVPLMETGLRYDEAVARVPEYGHHSQRFVVGAGSDRYLPPLYSERDKNGRMKLRDDIDVPRNPVVLRSLNQARKVLNALVREYGSPTAVHIEVARDLSRPMDERRDIEKLQKEYRERNERARADFEADFGHKPSGAEFEKWLLYREQHGKCAYSLAPLDLRRVIDDPGYVQVDHALPYSRSYDDSKNNRVLVLTKVNQEKGNRTPYEFLEGAAETDRWRAFAAWVESNKSYRQAKRSRLLRKNFGVDEAQSFRDRNLNDTRYICRFFKNYVERFLLLDAADGPKRCVVVNGQLTAFLRARWGFTKVREESDRHHALDAIVVAACSHALVKRLSDHAREKELEYLREGFPDPETGEIHNPAAHREAVERFPEPWKQFRHEVLLRVSGTDALEMQQALKALGNYSERALAAAHPMFVSRAPQRRSAGAAHKETIYGKPIRLRASGGATQRVPLASLTPSDLDKLAEPHRNAKFYEAIRKRLEAHGGKGDKAFAPNLPFYKPDRDGNPTGPIVRTVTLDIEKLSGIPVRGGVARNDAMIRVDVFQKDQKFFLVPVYVHHTVAGLPNRAIVAYKDEAEWTEMDDTCRFLFSLHANDLIRITQKGKQPITGYFASCHRGTGALSIWSHDRSRRVSKDGGIEGIGVKVAQNLEKFQVDVLGRIYPAPPEKRRGVA